MSLYSECLKIVHSIERLNTQILEAISTRNGTKRNGENHMISKMLQMMEHIILCLYQVILTESYYEFTDFLSKIQCYQENILNHLEEITTLLFSTITNIVDVDSFKSHSDNLIQALHLQLDKIHNSDPSQIEKVHDELVKELISRNKTK
jgi:hypothetical protein